MGAGREIGVQDLLGHLHAVAAGVKEVQCLALGKPIRDVRLRVDPVQKLQHLRSPDLRKTGILILQVGLLHRSRLLRGFTSDRCANWPETRLSAVNSRMKWKWKLVAFASETGWPSDFASGIRHAIPCVRDEMGNGGFLGGELGLACVQ